VARVSETGTEKSRTTTGSRRLKPEDVFPSLAKKKSEERQSFKAQERKSFQYKDKSPFN
jgi:hypothetical protein